MPVAYLIHGFLGVGKTTYAQRLEKETGAVRFSPDERMTQLHGDDPSAEHFARFHVAIMAQLNDEWPRAVQSGHDVILDYGFWTRAERDAVRHTAQSLGAIVQLYVIDCPEAIARQRIRLRNTMLRGSLFIADASYDLLRARFEPLQDDEPHLRVDSAD
jgi:predicted kinase